MEKEAKMPKRYSAKLKFQIVMELIQGEKTAGEVAKAYGVHPNSASAWRREFLEKGPEVFAEDTTIQDYERRIAELEQLLGKKEMEIALLKNFLGQTK
jgi:transposase-like protein